MKILCFGDSNTYGYDPRDCFGGQYSAQYRWVDLLAVRLGCTVINAGENGRRVPFREGELQGFRRLLKNNQPLDLVIIRLGTNDLLQGLSPEMTASRMEHLLMDMDSLKHRVLLIAPPPMMQGAWVPDQALIDHSIILGNIYQAISKRLGICFAGQWEIPMTFDGVHFTEAGHEKFARKLIETIQNRNG